MRRTHDVLTIFERNKEKRNEEWMKMKLLKKRLFLKTNSDCEVTFWEEVAGALLVAAEQTNKQRNETKCNH